MCRLLQKTLNILDDLALCSDDNDNDMTFVGDIVYLWYCDIAHDCKVAL